MNSENRESVRSVARISLALVLYAAVVLGCVDPPPSAPGLQVPPLQASGSGWQAGLLSCKPLAYDSVTKTIGPGGGELRVSRHVLSIPGGALHDRVAITAVAPSDTVNRVQLRPEGLVFNKSVSLTMSYTNCNVKQSSQPKQIAYTDDSLVILEYVPSVDDVIGKKVTGLLSHFSEYAPSW